MNRLKLAALSSLFLIALMGPGFSKPEDILDFYHLLAGESKIPDILENRNGSWNFKSMLGEDSVEPAVKPVIDKKNGYIQAVYTVEACRSDLERFLFIAFCLKQAPGNFKLI